MTTKKNRKLHLAMYGSRYKRHFLDEGFYCFYCGDPASCLDHLPSLSLMPDISLEEIKKRKIACSLLTVCEECNSSSSAKKHFYPIDRLVFLESHYEKQFKKMKSLWTNDEIEELGPSLKEYIKARQERINRYIDKIRGIQKRLALPHTYPIFEEEVK